MRLIKILFFFLFFLIFATPCVAKNIVWQNEKVDILIYTKQLNNKYNILIEFNIKDGWFISWDNPGDAGIPTSFDWNKAVKRLNESTPKVILHDNILGQYGYLDKAFYLFETKATNNDIKLKISWEACKDECKKESADINIILSNNNILEYDKKYTEAQKTFPSELVMNAKAEITYDKESAILNIYMDNINELSEVNTPYFIPYQKSVIYAAEPQKMYKSDNKTILSVMLENVTIPSQGGLLIHNDNAYKIRLTPITDHISVNELLYVLILAFLGGILLNFMPCVFPVLSLKAMSVSNNRNIKKALLYLSGVISCFLMLAGILFLLRQSGKAIGWGFQLQSVTFVFIMLLIFIVLFLMILDIIKINPMLLNWFNKMGNINSFMSGFFAVLIASPCTGPFLGAALGFTLMQSASIYFMIFFSLGLGYALPFTLVELFPKAINKIIPKSGKWTKQIKYILSVPILFTCVWLTWILIYQFNGIEATKNNKHFKDYDETEIRKLINSNKPVFIEFTAKWCLTCLLNEKNVLNNEKFISLAKQKNIALFRADWTQSNEDIGQAIKAYGRNSVPLYVYYPQLNQQYIILPQILTFDTVKSVFNDKNSNRN